MFKALFAFCALVAVASVVVGLVPELGRPRACAVLQSWHVEAIMKCRIPPPPPCGSVAFLPADHPVWTCWPKRMRPRP